jgi:predicted RND superfamily exporter protein
MTLSESIVFVTEHNDGSADFTIVVDDDDHKFSASPEDGQAIVEYEETLSWRGEIRVSEPRNEVFKMLMQSNEMTNYLESNDLTGVRREKHD